MKNGTLDKKYVENCFKKFVGCALQNCVRDYFKKESNIEKNEFLVEDFTEIRICYCDEYFCGVNKVKMMDEFICIENEALFDGLNELDEIQKNIIYLSSVEGLSDPEISEKLNIHRRTVQRIRKKSLDFLKNKLEAREHE